MHVAGARRAVAEESESDRGPAEGEPVVLLHGFPADRHSWDGVAGRLVGAGYRTLAPDQRGYSPQAVPSGRSAYRLDSLACMFGCHPIDLMSDPRELFGTPSNGDQGPEQEWAPREDASTEKALVASNGLRA